ncbi:hypothetical protein KW782_03665 [Candidatus Parcubacteria bacterium]|nr:hypothetical protein [Candidatus Parcubacteria bacterium]
MNNTFDFKKYYPDLRDPSTLSLILSNILTIVLAIVQNWDFLTTLLVYWSQSVIIGFFCYLRMRSLKNFTTEGLTFNGIPVPEGTSSRNMVASFFAFHYGIFHILYFFFISFFAYLGAEIDMKHVGIGALIFFLNHLYSYLYNRRKVSTKKENIGYIMFFPYLRVIPMQFTIVFGLPLPLFLVLKSAIDVVMHTIDQKRNDTTSV